MSSSAAVSRPYIKVKDKAFFSWPKIKAQAILAWRTGSLRLKTQWKLYNVKRGVGVDCVMPLCDGPDTLDHIKSCMWYETKWSDKWSTESDIANFLVKINRERLKKVKMPILWRSMIMYMYLKTLEGHPVSSDRVYNFENYNYFLSQDYSKLSFKCLDISQIRCNYFEFILK